MAPYPGSQKREAEGGGPLRLSDLVMSGVTASLPGWEVERGRGRGASAAAAPDAGAGRQGPHTRFTCPPLIETKVILLFLSSKAGGFCLNLCKRSGQSSNHERSY